MGETRPVVYAVVCAAPSSKGGLRRFIFLTVYFEWAKKGTGWCPDLVAYPTSPPLASGGGKWGLLYKESVVAAAFLAVEGSVCLCLSGEGKTGSSSAGGCIPPGPDLDLQAGYLGWLPFPCAQ